MIETRIVVACPGCQTADDRTVTAWMRPGHAGLAINRMHVHANTPGLQAIVDGAWVISHLTGLGQGAVGFGRVAFEHRAQAEHALDLLTNLPVDWRLPANHPSFRDPVLVSILNAIVDEAQALDANLDLPGAER